MMQFSFLFYFLSLLLMPTKSNQPAPPAASLYQHTLPQASILFSAHLRPVADGLIERIEAFGKEPLIANNPGFSAAFNDIVDSMKKNLARFQQETGIDPLKDLHAITFSLAFPARKPDVLFALHGKFNEQHLARVAKLMRLHDPQSIQLNNFLLFKNSNPRDVSLALTPEGQILIADAKTLENHAARPAQEDLARASMIRAAQPNDLMSFQLFSNPQLLQRMRRSRIPGLLRELVEDWKTLHFHASIKESRLRIRAKTPHAQARSEHFIRAAEAFAKASNQGFQGVFKLLDSFLDDDASQINPGGILTVALQNKKPLMELLQRRIGSLTLQTQVTREKDGTSLLLKGQMGGLLTQISAIGGTSLGMVSWLLWSLPRKRSQRAYPVPQKRSQSVPAPQSVPAQPPPPIAPQNP
jgi:hypothetical protein